MAHDSTDTSGGAATKGKKRGGFRWFRWLLLYPAVLLYAAGFALGAFGPRLQGVDVATPPETVPPEAVEFLADLTGTNPNGVRVCHQQTFDALLQLVRDARGTLVLDQFLVNTFHDKAAPGTLPRDTTAELVQTLLEKKRADPGLFILFITDPINAAYRDECPPALRPLADAGIPVLVTPHDLMADSNHLYSPFYRAAGPLLGLWSAVDRRDLPNVLEAGGAPFSWREFGRLLNFKANHRKVAVFLDHDGRGRALVSSANPHTASSAHDNSALKLENAGPLRPILQSELRLAQSILLQRPENGHGRTPGAALELLRDVDRRLAAVPPPPAPPPAATPDAPQVQYLTERAIGDAVVRELAQAGAGDNVDVMQFYLSDLGVIRALKDAAGRGARVRLLLDPNVDAFGRAKDGIPNRVVAHDLANWAREGRRDLVVRWFATHGEQGHAKSLHVYRPDGSRNILLAGSANFTTRNLGGSNLEADLLVRNSVEAGAAHQKVFTTAWENSGNTVYSVEYPAHALSGPVETAWKKIRTGFGMLTGCWTN